MDFGVLRLVNLCWEFLSLDSTFDLLESFHEASVPKGGRPLRFCPSQGCGPIRHSALSLRDTGLVPGVVDQTNGK